MVDLIILSLLAFLISLPCSQGCVDNNSQYCGAWKKAGFCAPTSQYFSHMQKNCQKTCGLCAPPGCSDKGGYCSSYASYCKDPGYKDYLIKECKLTCNYCHITTVAPPTTPLVTIPPYTGPGGRAVQPGCGKKGPGHTRIVGGKNAKPGDWPWQVNIDYEDNISNPGHLCGGTLITEEWVLSAAHCFYADQNKDKYWLKLGEHDIKTNSSWEQRFDIAQLILHPKYNNNNFDYDLALIRLKSKAKLNSRVQTACVSGQNTSFPVGTKCYITGWGLLKEYGIGPAILQQAQVPLVEQSKCKKAYSTHGLSITPTMFCAGYEHGGIDSCEGDSGGPLVCKKNNPATGEDTWFLWGTISWGVGCARKGLYGVLSSPKVLRSFLDQHVFKGSV